MREIICKILIVLCLCQAMISQAQTDTAVSSPEMIEVVADSARHDKKGLIARFMQYLAESNQPKKDKAFDFSILGGPHYSSDRGFGVGLVAAGLYSTDRDDDRLQPSNVSLTFDATTNKFFQRDSTTSPYFRMTSDGSRRR